MRTPVLLVAATLTIAIVLAASLLVVIEIRGHRRIGGSGERPAQRYAHLQAALDGPRPHLRFESIMPQSASMRSIAS
jgi:hypothetical protein